MNLEEAMRERITEIEADLATESAAREQAEEMRNHWCSEYANSQNQLATAVEQRDTALARAQHAEGKAELRTRDFALAHQARVAAETALASARKLLERADRYIEQQPHDYGAGLRRDIRALLWPDGGLTSHPAPVAATSMSLLAAASKVTKLWADLSSQELYGEALDELLQDDRQELEDAMQALRDAERGPVAAPCARCAAARELLRTADDTPQDLLTSAWRMLVRAWLKEHP